MMIVFIELMNAIRIYDYLQCIDEKEDVLFHIKIDM